MKINNNIIDISHETIQEETDESIAISVKNVSEDDDFEVRFHLEYRKNQSVLIAACVDKMNSNSDARNFFMKVQDEYFQQFE
tara:strand:+ start:2840 stop:3085 length:246 start_codon:yes stop_codon:yes gene_type:complete